MPNKVSARKRVRQNEKRRVRNRSARSEMRTSVKKVTAALTTGAGDDLKALVSAAQSKLGKAAKRGLIKKNTAARTQSRLMKAASKAATAARA